MSEGKGSPEDLWIVELPPGIETSRDKIAFAGAAERLLGGLVDVAQGGRSDALFVVLMDAKIRCKRYAKLVEASDLEARAERLRAELREVEGAMGRGES
ncbi:MAG: hypothetical protein M3R38_03795 [Actinomycetota bacterium]|nr:hypothetical protein [Actinomycetota bacterium]